MKQEELETDLEDLEDEFIIDEESIRIRIRLWYCGFML